MTKKLLSIYHAKINTKDKLAKARQLISAVSSSLPTQMTRIAAGFFDGSEKKPDKPAFMSATAAEMKSFLFYYSEHVLGALLSPADFKPWGLFLEFSVLALAYTVRTSELHPMGGKFEEFVDSLKATFPGVLLPINFHYALHYGDTLRDFGPAYTTWW